MRCKICDYSPTAPSEFHTGLLTHQPDVRLRRDRREGGFVCSVCFEEVGRTMFYGKVDEPEAWGTTPFLTPEWDA